MDNPNGTYHHEFLLAICTTVDERFPKTKQRQVKVDWYELLCFGSPTVQLAHQYI